MRHIVIGTLIFCLTGSPAIAQSLLRSTPPGISQTFEESLRRSALAIAAQQSTSDESGIPPAYKWTGIGLLGGGGLYLALGAASKDLCSGSGVRTCDSVKTVFLTFGAAMLGTGAVLLVIGKGKAKKGVSPQLVTAPGAVAIGGRVTF